ncbi:hypothetical protein Vretimale_7300 [Volvox reticuliferus]|uniref:SRCR domain-containing protein n=1 Tax=Volvox reticuliferus TaxID=1737510 RepID=A0A8J4D3E4_9CHLO|nr:hypothetical protein Vretifemale_19419 [Volvox reticuliferus]GIM02424.1 hypothetical protein Vretimale_7300 [Volvox reticuliferus]
MAAQLTIRRRKRTMPILSSQLLVLTTVATIITALGFALTTTMAANSPPPSPKRPPPPVKSPKPPPPVKLSPPPKPPPPVKLSPPPKLSSPPKSPPASRYPRPPPPTPSLSSFNDTLRLVRGSELKGRLEVKVVGPYPDGEWVTLCDDGSFTTYEAMLICQKCGFLYGRPYYANGINSFGADEVYRPDTVGNIICKGDGESIPPDAFVITRLLFFDQYEMWCYVFQSTCPNQVLVGLECSNNPFPTASPPPPVPPRPPPPPFPPPSMQNDIKLIVVDDNQVPHINRVELRVNSSSDGHTGPSVWAPLCAPSNDDVYGYYERTFGLTICKQADGFKTSPFRFYAGVEFIKYALPTGPISSLGGFDPAQYTRWVTVVGNFDAYTVQGMTLEVSSQPCASGFILGLRCFEVMA